MEMELGSDEDEIYVDADMMVIMDIEVKVTARTRYVRTVTVKKLVKHSF